MQWLGEVDTAPDSNSHLNVACKTESFVKSPKTLALSVGPRILMVRFPVTAVRTWLPTHVCLGLAELLGSFRACCRLCSGVRNPVGVKVGPTARPEEVVELCRALNPENVPGKVTLITRYVRKRNSRSEHVADSIV